MVIDLLPLYQMYLFTGGLASLLQVRVTVLPSITSPGGSIDTEGIFGGSGGINIDNITLLCMQHFYV